MTDSLCKAEYRECEVPLHELLEGVPESARLVIDSEDGMSTSYIPVGYLCKRAAKALREALAQPEQEPVAYYYKSFHGNRGVSLYKETEEWQPLYTAPPKREWVDLDEEEQKECWDEGGSQWAIYQNIASKLKERNG